MNILIQISFQITQAKFTLRPETIVNFFSIYYLWIIIRIIPESLLLHLPFSYIPHIICIDLYQPILRAISGLMTWNKYSSESMRNKYDKAR